MLGFSILYKPTNTINRTLFNHTLFGRLVYKNYRGRKYAYYYKGMLDNTKFTHLLTSKIFVENMKDIDVSILEKFAVIEVSECIREDDKLTLLTGREYWERIAKEKEMVIRTPN